jgi:CubicO group peptidase (beta-lactamase class C family)
MKISRYRSIIHGVLYSLLVLLVLLVLAFAAHPGTAGARQPSPDFAAIDRYVELEMQATRLPGLALGIVQGDQIIHLKGFGSADTGGRLVTPQTPFVIESLSKSFTALAIMQLVEQGKLDLDAPVQRYLPWFRVADPDTSAHMTLRHLLHQTSGLSQLTGNLFHVRTDISDDALEHEVRSLLTVRTKPLGQTYEYSNMNYTILGLIVQTVSGQSYEEYIQQHILEPLAMHDSYGALADARRNGLATGYKFWFGRPRPIPVDEPYNRAAAPEGLISASAEDMTHYLIAQLNGGHYDRATVLSPTGIATLHRPAATESLSTTYAMGWIAEETNGVATVWHNGAGEGFQSHMILVPEGRWGIVVLVNGIDLLNFEHIDGIAGGVMSLLVGRPRPLVPFEVFGAIFLGLLVVGVLQVIGLVRSVVLLRRWRAEPARRPRSVVGVVGRVGLPLLLNLAWVGLLLRFFVEGLTVEHVLLLMLSDLGWMGLVSGVVALGWGILRAVLAFLVLRKGSAPKAAIAPAAA